MDRQTFVSFVEKNANRVTHYEMGMDGQTGGCDCIGLIIGALRMGGVKWTGTHGSNYAARYETEAFRSVVHAENLCVGDVVYKAKEKGETGYHLPGKYESHPDTRDYYHVGVVTKVSPLVITHCSTGGIHRDSHPGAWKYAGRLKQVEDGMFESYTACVHSENGGPVNLREKPDKQSRKIKAILSGTKLTVLGHPASGWAEVCVQDVRGYMMRAFLRPEDTVTLQLPRSAAEQLYQALKTFLSA